MNNKQKNQHYNDLLFWLSSPMNNKDFKLTPSEVNILRKLIHYSQKDNKITYSNNIIAQHVFLSERTVENALQHFNRLGLISSAYVKIFDGGKYHTRRTSFIQWELLDKLKLQVPTFEEVIEDKVELPQPEQKENIKQESTKPEIKKAPHVEPIIEKQLSTKERLIKMAKASGLTKLGIDDLMDLINNNIDGYTSEEELEQAIKSMRSYYSDTIEKNQEYKEKKELEVIEDNLEELYEDDGNELTM